MEDLLVFGSAILILVAIILQTQAIMWLSTARHLMKARALREDLEFLGEIIPQAIQEAMKVYPAGDEWVHSGRAADDEAGIENEG